MKTEPDLLDIEEQLRRIFRDRLGVVSLEDCVAYWTVSTSRYQRITGDELARVAELLAVPLEAIEFEDSQPNAIRFIADCSPITRPDTPAAKRGE